MISGGCNQSGLPVEQCQPDNDLSMMMMFDGLPDLKTGTSLKDHQVKEFDFGEEAMRVTTTEAYDIFDDNDGIWNASICLGHG